MRKLGGRLWQRTKKVDGGKKKEENMGLGLAKKRRKGKKFRC
jgi:hypothetical protein